MVEQLQQKLQEGVRDYHWIACNPHGKKLKIGDETYKLEREYALLVTKSGPS